MNRKQIIAIVVGVWLLIGLIVTMGTKGGSEDEVPRSDSTHEETHAPVSVIATSAEVHMARQAALDQSWDYGVELLGEIDAQP